jgi:hypothetical protein
MGCSRISCATNSLSFIGASGFISSLSAQLDMTVRRLHDSYPRHHRVSAAAAQHQHFDRRLPFRQVGFLLRQLRNLVGRVLQRQELPMGSAKRVDQGTQ